MSIRTAVALLIASLALPVAAPAQPHGVFVDPESPAGTEYVIPLEEARRQAAGGDDERSGRGARGQPLFGAGIERATSASAGGGGGESESAAGARDGRDGRGKVEDGKTAGPEDTGRGPRSSVAVQAAASGESEALTTAGIAGSVLVVGLLVGFGLRRLLRSE